VAAAFDAEPETFRKDFRREEGIPLSYYLRAQKVEAVKNLLATSNMKCNAIDQPPFRDPRCELGFSIS
jgi:methylphosphotriester-DNA--protein-cysteine methyltransferase